MNFVRTGTRLKQHLAFTVEQTALPGAVCTLIRLVTGRIAVANADDFGVAFDRELNHIAGIRHFTAFAVEHCNIHHGDVLPVGHHRCFVRRKHDFRRHAGGFNFGLQDFTFFVTDGFQFTRLVNDRPLKVSVAGHCFFALTGSVQK